MVFGRLWEPWNGAAFGTSQTTARHNSKWRAVEKRRQIRRFWAGTPTARQIENWQPVVYFPGNNPTFAIFEELWRAVVRRLSGALTT
jgi:hypothetical protein